MSNFAEILVIQGTPRESGEPIPYNRDAEIEAVEAKRVFDVAPPSGAERDMLKFKVHVLVTYEPNTRNPIIFTTTDRDEVLAKLQRLPGGSEWVIKAVPVSIPDEDEDED